MGAWLGAIADWTGAAIADGAVVDDTAGVAIGAGVTTGLEVVVVVLTGVG